MNEPEMPYCGGCIGMLEKIKSEEWYYIKEGGSITYWRRWKRIVYVGLDTDRVMHLLDELSNGEMKSL